MLLSISAGAAIAMAIGGIIAGGINAASQARQNRKSQEFAHDEAELAHQRQKDLLDYNSPSYQMSRLIDAGLNPNLAYDNLEGSIPSGAQAAQPSLRAPVIDSGVDSALKVAQIRRLDAASQNETELTDAQVANLYKGLDVKDAEVKDLYAHAQSLQQSVVESNARVSLLNEQTREKALDAAFKDETFKTRVEQLSTSLSIDKAQAASMERYMTAKCLGLESQAQLYLSQCHLNSVQERLITAMGSFYGNLTTGAAYDNILKGQQVQSSQLPMVLHGINTGISAGVYSAYSSARSNALRYEIVDMQNNLLQKFGSAQEMMKLILGYSNAFESTANGISTLVETFVPKVGESKTSGPGGVVRRYSKSGLDY